MKTGYLKIWQKITPRKKAQAMVEFALALPFLLLVIFGILEFGRLLYAWIIVENSARFGLRYATTGQYDPQPTAHSGFDVASQDCNAAAA